MIQQLLFMQGTHLNRIDMTNCLLVVFSTFNFIFDLFSKKMDFSWFCFGSQDYIFHFRSNLLIISYKNYSRWSKCTCVCVCECGSLLIFVYKVHGFAVKLRTNKKILNDRINTKWRMLKWILHEYIMMFCIFIICGVFCIEMLRRLNRYSCND